MHLTPPSPRPYARTRTHIRTRTTRTENTLRGRTKDRADLRSSVTLRQLLGFVSGFDGGSSCGTRDFMACAEHTYNTVTLATPPGTAFEYNSIHLRFAGAMAVAATNGTAMAEIVRERVFLPARMVGTEWYVPHHYDSSLYSSL